MSEEGELPVSIAPEAIGGVYSDVVMVWHNDRTFTLDFLTQAMPNNPQVHIVARVRVPPSVIFQIARAIADNVDSYEKQHGKILMPGGPQQSEESS